MPTSPLKRPSATGRLGRLLADLVMKNHVRLKNPKRRHRPSAAAPPSPAPPAAAEPPPPQRCEVLTVRNAVVRPKTKGAVFSIRPELLAVGGAVALTLLVIWSKWLVAAATAASVALFWVDSVRSSGPRRRTRPETKEGLVSSCVSPIREAVSEAGTPRSSCADSDRGSGGDGDDSISITPKGKEKKRRWMRELIAKKLRKGKRSEVDKDTITGEAVVNTIPVENEPQSPAPAVDAITVERCREAGSFPWAALVPITLVGLVAGKLPAVALTVLCAVFFITVDRVQIALHSFLTSE